MRKARLGFRIISLDGELLIDEDADLERIQKDKDYRSHEKRKKSWLAYYYRDTESYNKKRRVKNLSVDRVYAEAKRNAIRQGREWEFDKEQWINMWLDAGWVIIPGSKTPSNPKGEKRTAYSLRGPNVQNNTMMLRKDLTKPWRPDNCYIAYRGNPLIGSKYHYTTTNN